jgi:miniconductance mechanosensitive channel
VLLLIFRDTILSFIASIQISTQNLIKEGDMVDIPAFGASGIITEIDLQTVTVQNWDNTNTSIPTSKIVDSGLKNYRLMIESGARRVKRSILVEVDTIKFVDQDLVKKLESTDFIQQRIGEELQDDSKQTTNLQLFIRYTRAYLRSIKEVRQRRYPLFVRILETTSEGLPVEIIVFVKVADLDKFNEIQAEIILHMIAVLPYFDLKSYQLQLDR